jgi:hypothetical protein
MTTEDPTDDEIRQANGVILIDPSRGWRGTVGPLPAGQVADDGVATDYDGDLLHIPVDSTDVDRLKRWMERIERVRR